MKISIAHRFALTFSLLVLLATATVGFFVFQGARRALIAASTDRLAHTADLIELRLMATVDAIGKDVRFLANTPPAQGVVRVRSLGRSGDQLDPTMAISDNEWRTLLAGVFREFMETRPSFRAISFAEVSGDGRELLRIEREHAAVVRAPASDLDRLGDEVYFDQAVEVANQPRHVLQLSDTGLDDMLGPSLVIAYPVLKENGDVFGVMSIEADLHRVMRSLRAMAQPYKTLVIASDSALFLLEPDTTHVVPVGVGEHPLARMFPQVRTLSSGINGDLRIEQTTMDDGTTVSAYFERVRLNPDDARQTLTLGVTSAHAEALARVREVRDRSIFITLLFSLGGVFLAWALAGLLTRPLSRVTRAVTRFGHNDDGWRSDLPAARQDEIGVLAESFEDMASRIKQQVVALRKERGRLQRLSETLEDRVRTRTDDLARTNRALELRNRELQEFAYVASHDLQEPLRKIRAFGSLLASEHGDALGDEGAHYIERMNNAAERMSSLISDLLNFSRVTTKGEPFQPTDLNATLQEVLSDLEFRLDEERGRIEAEPLPTIEADPMQMRQLLQNLIGNALKFHREDVAPVVRIQAEEEPPGTLPGTDGPVCRLIIEDNGIGFEEKYGDRIFTPFQRLHGRSSYEGTGMGLAICRRIVERHGGMIEAESTLGEGSRFIVRLPMQHEAVATEAVIMAE